MRTVLGLVPGEMPRGYPRGEEGPFPFGYQRAQEKGPLGWAELADYFRYRLLETPAALVREGESEKSPGRPNRLTRELRGEKKSYDPIVNNNNKHRTRVARLVCVLGGAAILYQILCRR